MDDGTSISDVDDEEKRRHFTIDCHLLHCEWKDKQVHLIDSPGYPDFIGNALSALAAVENVVLTISAPSGIEVNTRRIFQEAGRLKLGGLIALTKMDADNVDFVGLLDGIRETFGTRCVPFIVPIGQGPTFSGVVDVLDPPIEPPGGCPMAPVRGVPDGRRADRRDRRGADGALPRRRDDPARGAPRPPRTARSSAGTVIPIVCLSARKDIGVQETLALLDRHLASPPTSSTATATTRPTTRTTSSSSRTRRASSSPRSSRRRTTCSWAS